MAIIKKAPKLKRAKKKKAYIDTQKRERLSKEISNALKDAGLDTRTSNAEAKRIINKYKYLFVEYR